MADMLTRYRQLESFLADQPEHLDTLHELAQDSVRLEEYENALVNRGACLLCQNEGVILP